MDDSSNIQNNTGLPFIGTYVYMIPTPLFTL